MKNAAQPADAVQVTDENIQAIYDHQQAEFKAQGRAERVADKIASWSGTVSFIIVHLCLFAAWIILNVTVVKFDPFPFVLLITAVSLESIMLSGFLLLSQNKFAEESERQHKLDLQINLLAERESTAMLRLIILMAKKLKISEKDLQEVRNLSDDTDPTDILERIIEVEKQDSRK